MVSKKVGMDRIHDHEAVLGEYLYRELEKIPGLTLYGPHPDQQSRTGLVAFNCDTVHATDLSFFDREAWPYAQATTARSLYIVSWARQGVCKHLLL